jgi:hypothetical protein
MEGNFWDRFKRGSQNKNQREQKSKQEFRYGEPVDNFPVKNLKKGQYLRLKTQSGSDYTFQITDITQLEGVGPLPVATFYSGPETLRGAEGFISSEELRIGEVFYLSSGSHTSRLKEIVVTEHPPPPTQSTNRRVWRGRFRNWRLYPYNHRKRFSILFSNNFPQRKTSFF